jgi:hypothetical protein
MVYFASIFGLSLLLFDRQGVLKPLMELWNVLRIGSDSLLSLFVGQSCEHANRAGDV